MTPQRAESGRHSVNFLQSASNVVITGSSFTGITVQRDYADPLERLYTRVASNAILNAGGRADDVRCHPGTREEVIRIIEKWIDGEGDLSRGIFWLSGPAGTGKTAIIQTIAERCIQRNVPMANFFFFRGDSTRNHAGSVIATLLYQLWDFYPELKTYITTLLDTKPLTFDQSIKDQFQHLIDVPVRSVVDNSAHTKRLVLFIDGLDECSPDNKSVQGDLLRALHHLASEPRSPFAVLVASRAEPHLVMVLNEIGSSKDSIFLDETYHPSDDIRLFVTEEFDKIKRNHHLGQVLDADWPPKASVDEIVQKSSGQFIYAATIMRFISLSPASPAYSLDKVRGIRPIVKNSPFSELDAIYTYILAQVEDWDMVKDILASQFILSAIRELDATLCGFFAPLGLTQADIESSLSSLVTVMQYKRKIDHVIFYHASLRDFLRDRSRSSALYIDLNLFAVKMAIMYMSTMSSFRDVESFCVIFTQVEVDTPLLRDALMCWKPWQPEIPHTRNQLGWKTQAFANRCLFSLERLYHEDNDMFYRTMLRKWLMWFSDLELPKPAFCDKGGRREATNIWDDIQREKMILQRSRTGETARPKVAFWKRTLGKIRPFKK